MSGPGVIIRAATSADVAPLRDLIEASVRGLQGSEYTQAQIEGALASVYGVDSQLIADGTYCLVETAAGYPVGCGGWSMRRTLFGGDQFAGREDSLLDPARDAAKIRAFFVHPAWTRTGIGTMLLDECEAAARRHGFRRLELGATLTGVPFYRASGYVDREAMEVALPNGQGLRLVRMEKLLPDATRGV